MAVVALTTVRSFKIGLVAVAGEPQYPYIVMRYKYPDPGRAMTDA
jgi:hypothetical protein